jgi:SH3-like domain-containing protein
MKTMKLLTASTVATVLGLGALLLTSLPATARPARVTTDANVRSSASLNATVLDVLSPNSTVEVLNIVLARDGDYWYYVRSDIEGTAEGWVRSNLISFGRSNLTYGTLAGQRGDRINVRSSPRLESRVLHYGLSGDLVTVGQTYKEFSSDRWYEVTFPNGASGWVRADLISVWQKGCIITCPAN